jgi:hypothetical protein
MYRCRDDVWLFVCALTPSFFFKLLEALDEMDVMLLPEVDGEFAKFVTPPVQAIANTRFAARMAEFDSDHWAARFDEVGVPYAPVQTRADWAAGGTVAANDLLVPVPGDDGTVGPGLPAVLSRTPGSLTASTATARTERADASDGGGSVAVVEAEADLHRHLEPHDVTLVHRAADVGDLEPVEVAQRLRRPPDAAADRGVDAVRRRPDDLGDLVRVIHRNPPGTERADASEGER